MVHQFNSNMAPDSAFVAGTLEHLVIGNRGRLLDPRRTPVRIVALATQSGHFIVEIEDFEDRGAHWEIPFEGVTSYQFERGSSLALQADVESYFESVKRFDRMLIIPCNPHGKVTTDHRVNQLTEIATTWLSDNSTFIAEGGQLDFGSCRGPQSLSLDLQAFMGVYGLQEMEDAFASRFVGNPHSGELVKGHRIVMAELGLAPYQDKVIRDPALFAAPWTKERRADHILLRLAFLRALLPRLGHNTVTLYRGLVFDSYPDPPRSETFVSTSFNFDVAQSCFAPRETNRAGLIMRQVVPVERLFMTYLETAQMNQHYLEAEAVLLYEPDNPLF